MRRIGGTLYGANMLDLRKLYLAKVRPLIAYACAVWYVPQYAFKQRWTERLEKLQRQCLNVVAGCWQTTNYLMVLNELNIEMLSDFLGQASVSYRAKMVCFPGRLFLTLLRTNPPQLDSDQDRLLRQLRERPIYSLPMKYCSLDEHPFRGLYDEEADDLRKAAMSRLKQDDKEPADAADEKNSSRTKKKKKKKPKPVQTKPPKDPNERLKSYITRQAKVAIVECMTQRWEEFVQSKIEQKERSKYAYGSRTLVPALLESWGPDSLNYYKGMKRIHQTALMRMRTNKIGVGANVSKFDQSVSPYCSCGLGRHTVKHLFLFCPNLRAEQDALTRELCHSSFVLMLTKNAKHAAEWAVNHLGLDEFSPRSRHMEEHDYSKPKPWHSLFEGT